MPFCMREVKSSIALQIKKQQLSFFYASTSLNLVKTIRYNRSIIEERG